MDNINQQFFKTLYYLWFYYKYNENILSIILLYLGIKYFYFKIIGKIIPEIIIAEANILAKMHGTKISEETWVQTWMENKL